MGLVVPASRPLDACAARSAGHAIEHDVGPPVAATRGILEAECRASIATCRYVDGLPDGLDSYPHCVAKASLLSHALRSRPISPPPGSLPEPVRRLIEQPPPVSTWISKVAFNAAVLAMYDEAFGGDDLPGFGGWVCDINRQLFVNPLYRVLFAFVSPSRLVSPRRPHSAPRRA